MPSAFVPPGVESRFVSVLDATHVQKFRAVVDKLEEVTVVCWPNIGLV